MAGRILGMGDVLTLIEQAEQVFEKEEAEAAAAKMFEGEFTLDDFLEQLQQVKKMGSISSIMGMLPGMPKEMKNAEIGDDHVKVTEAIIRSMTPEERRRPEIINGSRRVRIAKGSGTTVPDVNRLVKQFGEMQKMMKQMGGLAGKKSGKKGKAPKMNPVKMAKAMKQMGAGDLSGLGNLGGNFGAPGQPGLPGQKNPGAFPDFRDFR
jgi:signal recognition particle subunit SRP54